MYWLLITNFGWIEDLLNRRRHFIGQENSCLETRQYIPVNCRRKMKCICAKSSLLSIKWYQKQESKNLCSSHAYPSILTPAMPNSALWLNFFYLIIFSLIRLSSSITQIFLRLLPSNSNIIIYNIFIYGFLFYFFMIFCLYSKLIFVFILI